MIRADAKRWSLGLLAGFAALPLPLNEPRPEGVVGWGFLLLYEMGIVLFLLRVQRSEQEWLRPWMLNVLGLIYLPLLVIDLSALSRGQLLRPMMHLALFVLLVKLFSLVNEKDKWQTLMAVFFVFVTSMATSTSPFIVVYMLCFLVLAVRTLDDFAEFHLRSVGVEATEAPVRQGKIRLAWILSLAGVVLAIPLFVALPRFANPFVLGRAQSANNTAAGFSDEAGLDGIGRIRESQDVALRIESDSDLRPVDLRLRGATFDGFEGDHWSPSGGLDLLPRAGDGQRYRVADVDAGEDLPRARISRLPLRARALIVPSTTVEVEFEGPTTPLVQGRGGALSLVTPPRSTRIYEVTLGERPTYPQAPDAEERERLTSREGVSSRIDQLAAEIVDGWQGPGQEATAIESHLTTNYSYTLDLIGRSDTSPIEEFLFERPSGHCEYFASSMVLLLRARGIPARYVTGFLGAEQSLGYWIVRQNNAHAWVEAWIDGQGWQTYDPTPPDGRPLTAPRSMSRLLMQAWDFVVYRWDSSIIAFSQGDQFRLFSRLRRWLANRFREAPAEEPPSLPMPSADARDDVLLPDMPPEARLTAVKAVIPTTFLLTGLLLAWWLVRRAPLDPAGAYRRLIPLASRVGVEWRDSMAPREFERLLVEACPVAEPAVHELVGRYLQQSFSGRPLLDPAAGGAARRAYAAELQQLLGDVRRAVAERNRQLRQAARKGHRDVTAAGQDGDTSRRRAS